MFYDTYTQRHKTSLRYLSANYFGQNDLPYCALRSAQLFIIKKYIVNDEMVFQKNGAVDFISLSICVTNILFGIFIWNFGLAKSHL